MIIDTFTFFNELDILEIRLHELYDYVDKFVLVEASHTQSLMPKPFYFEENKARFTEFLDKIVHIKVEDKVSNDINPWSMENFQRNCILRGLDQLKLQGDETILVSDVDEIPKGLMVGILPKKINGSIVFGMTYNVYYLDLIMTNKVWHGTVATTPEMMYSLTPQTCIKTRDVAGPHNMLPNLAGWHFGYQGGKDLIYQKYFACIEPFSKNDIPAKALFDEVFKERAKDGGSFIFCDNLNRTDLKLQTIPLQWLPAYVQENMEKFKDFLLPIEFNKVDGV